MIGKFQLDQLAKEKDIKIIWKCFELRPEEDDLADPPEDTIEKIKRNLAAMSRKHGIKMTWNGKSKHSRRALEGSKFAEEHGLGDEYHNAVFAAQFQQGKDINDINVLVNIAEKIGLNKTAFQEDLITRKYEEAVLEECDEGYDLLLQSIPCYFVDDKRFYTYEELEQYLKEIDE